MIEKTIGAVEQYLEQGKLFHGYLSPGLVLGMFMVDLAQEHLGYCKSLRAVVETQSCVPDAVQIMTGCTYGNSWMRTKDWGKMAITLFDKESGDGVPALYPQGKLDGRGSQQEGALSVTSTPRLEPRGCAPVSGEILLRLL